MSDKTQQQKTELSMSDDKELSVKDMEMIGRLFTGDAEDMLSAAIYFDEKERERQKQPEVAAQIEKDKEDAKAGYMYGYNLAYTEQEFYDRYYEDGYNLVVFNGPDSADGRTITPQSSIGYPIGIEEGREWKGFLNSYSSYAYDGFQVAINEIYQIGINDGVKEWHRRREEDSIIEQRQIEKDKADVLQAYDVGYDAAYTDVWYNNIYYRGYSMGEGIASGYKSFDESYIFADSCQYKPTVPTYDEDTGFYRAWSEFYSTWEDYALKGFRDAAQEIGISAISDGIKDWNEASKAYESQYYDDMWYYPVD
jgi:hypothetical protein